MTEPEREVREALAKYKFALVVCDYRNWWHRLLVWAGDGEETRFSLALARTEADAKRICNQSEDHRRWVYVLHEHQPADLQARDRFLQLLDSRDAVSDAGDASAKYASLHERGCKQTCRVACATPTDIGTTAHAVQ